MVHAVRLFKYFIKVLFCVLFTCCVLLNELGIYFDLMTDGLFKFIAHRLLGKEPRHEL